MVTAKMVAEQAKKWVGARQGDSTYKEIMATFDRNTQGYIHDSEGCSEFACACALAFGIEGEKCIFVANWAEGLSNQYKAAGRFYTKGTPNIGDFVFWNTGSGKIDHTEIIVNVTDNHLWTVNGNENHTVAEYDCSIPKASIIGYGRNIYDSEPQPEKFDLEDALLNAIANDIRLTEGSTGELVKVLQRYLAGWNWYHGEINGIYDAAVTAAVLGWQVKNIELGIYDGDATGSVGRLSWQVILRDIQTNKNTFQEEHFIEYYKNNVVLKKGDRGSEVGFLQAYLSYYNFYNGGIDNDYGENTEKAVKAFQAENGLPVDGIINSDDWTVIQKG